MINTDESGRSMVEMLGVLAIIGVLSVMGIAGYTQAMKRYKANEAVSAIVMAAVVCGTGDETVNQFDRQNIVDITGCNAGTVSFELQGGVENDAVESLLGPSGSVNNEGKGTYKAVS